MRRILALVLLLLHLVMLCACGAPGTAPTAGQTPPADPKVTPDQTAGPDSTPEPDFTSTPEPDPTPTPEPEWDEHWVTLEKFFADAESYGSGPLDREVLMDRLTASGLQKADPDGPLQRQAVVYLMTLIFGLGPCTLPDELLPFADVVQVDPLCMDGVRHLYRLGCEPERMNWEDAAEGDLLFAPTENIHQNTVYAWLSFFYEATPADLSREEIMDYFRAVALHIEYSDSGQNQEVNLSRWNTPVYYRVIGSCTEEDLRLIELLTGRMNSVEGFPGIYPAAVGEVPDLLISFLSREEMDMRTSHLNESVDGYATYEWYNANWEIFHGEILYCDDLEQQHRPGVICEELIQIMGLCSDSDRYKDSLFYQYYSRVRWPGELDWKLFELVYHPALSSGLSADEVMAILAGLEF